MTRRERLQDWINTLDAIQMSRMILELTEYAIDSEEVGFYGTSKKPYWSNTGENLDGTVDEDDFDIPF